MEIKHNKACKIQWSEYSKGVLEANDCCLGTMLLKVWSSYQ